MPAVAASSFFRKTQVAPRACRSSSYMTEEGRKLPPAITRGGSAERRSVATQHLVEDEADAREVLDWFLAANHQGVVQHDLRSGSSHYDNRWHLLLGYQAEHRREDSPTLWQELTHPDDLAGVLDEWRSHVESAWPFQRTWRMLHREGGYRWIECNSTVKLDEFGNPSRALSLFADVTERVEATNRHVALLEALPDTIVRMTEDGTVIDLRAGTAAIWQALFGRPSLLPHSIGEVTRVPTLVGPLLQNARVAIASGRVQRFDHALSADGRPWHFEVRCSPSGPGEVVCLIHDITEKKALESQLLQAQKLESIGQLAAGIAHEINTPLQFISDNVHFADKAARRVLDLLAQYGARLNELVDEEEKKELRKQARQLKLQFLTDNIPSALSASVDGVARVAEIVAAMKEFSHPGSKRPAPSDINRALASTVKVSTNEWKTVADLELDMEPDLPPVSCILGEINQCFLNIIVNASHALKDKFGDDRTGRIRVSTRRYDAGVEIRIEDNGPGIPEDIRRRIFDPFFTTKGIGKGTGQGLSIARSTIVDKHRGTLTCESEVGQGTTFVIRLPFETAPDDEERAA